MRMAWSLSKVLTAVAAVVFFIAAIGEWPTDLQDDVEPVALGLALLAVSFVVP